MSENATDTRIKTEGWRLALRDKICSRKDFPNNRQNVHTPYKLCGEMIDKLDKSTNLHDKTFLTMNLEFIDVLIYDYGVDKSRIWCILDCSQKAVVLEKHERYTGVNVVRGDFLTWKPDMKFDVIVGNPPYQELNANGKNWGGGRKLWEDFVIKAESILKDGGFLCMVHPTTWRAYSDKALLKCIHQRNNPIYINLETAKRHFTGVGSYFDWYVIQKSKYNGKTQVESTGGTMTIDITEWDVIPNGFSPVMASILLKLWKSSDKLIFEKNQSHHSGRDHVSKEKSNKFCYPIQHTGAGELLWASNPHAVQYTKKILASRSGYLRPFYDSGERGVSQDAFFMKVKSKTEADYIIRWLNSNLMTFALSVTKTSGFFNHKCINTFPYPKGLPDNFADQDLYNHFKLTKEEIELIESSVS